MPNAVLHVPAREIPLPMHLSRAAKDQLAQVGLSNPPWPDADDLPAWRALIARMDAIGEVGLGGMADGVDADVQTIDADGVTVHVATPRDLSRDDRGVYLEFHGGALLWGGGECCRLMAKISAGMLGARVWSVDYRMAPDHPFPAPLQDGVTAYRALLRERDPKKIILGGASAGGNLAAATILKARDEGLPLPAGALLMTPELDLTEGGDTFATLLGIDTALTSCLMPANLLHAGGHSLTDPYVSPLFGNFARGFPPTFLQSGTRDLFLSNTVLMHRALRRANMPAELHVFEGATHVMFMEGAEAEDRNREVRAFVKRCWTRKWPKQRKTKQ